MSGGVIVLGMHRSGTSLIAEALHRWGAFGRTQECLPSDQWNARGYWELSPLVDFNERLLHEAGATWSFPPDQREDLRFAQMAAQPQYRKEALALLGSMKTREGGTWFWKDPRLSLLLPFWQKIWGNDVRYVICVRDPLEICRSLEKRDELSFPVSILLWQRYMLSVLEWTQNAPTLAIRYSSILQNPAAECARLSGFLQGSHSGHDVAADTTEMVKVVDRELRHHKAESARPSIMLTNGQTQLQQILELMTDCGHTTAELNLAGCALSWVWRSQLQTNLLLHRFWRRWNRVWPNFAETANYLAPVEGEPHFKAPNAKNNGSVSKDDFLRLAIQQWYRW